MKKKLLASILAVAVVASGTFTVVACNNSSKKQSSNVSTENELTGSGSMQIEENQGSNLRIKSKPIKTTQYAAYGVTPTAESAYTIQATIVPEHMSEYLELEWTVTFSRPDIPWAEGKDVNSFIKITPLDELGHEVVVECLIPFDVSIVIMVVAKDDPTITASCTCGYMNRFASVEAILGEGTSVTFNKDEITRFAFEPTIYGEGYLAINTFANESGGTIFDSYFALSMEINDVFVEKLEEKGFTVQSNGLTYGSLGYEQIVPGVSGYDTMLFLPGADAEILGAEDSALIRQAYFWITTGTDDDGVLSQEEKNAYIRYREAVIATINESLDELVTLKLTQYDEEFTKVYATYESKMMFQPYDLLPALAGLSLNFGNIIF